MIQAAPGADRYEAERAAIPNPPKSATKRKQSFFLTFGAVDYIIRTVFLFY